MVKPYKGFKAFETSHCVTGSMRHVYAFHKYPISEELLLGLGAGVGFVYWHMKGMSPFLGGRANTGRPGEEGLEKTAGRRTGVQVEAFRTSSAARAEKGLLEALARGPVMIRVDMGFLSYFDLPEGYHFGGHVVVVAGHDLEERVVLIADRDAELHPISFDELALARGAKFKPFPPGNTWFVFDVSHSRPPKPHEVKQAIQETVTCMLEPPISNLGVKGIRKAAARVPKWADTMNDDELRHACFNAFVFIDSTGGTGGGLFRYMYGRFLKEAVEITGKRRLGVVGHEMQRIGDQWQEVAGLFKEAATAARIPSRLCEAGRLLAGIADQEQAAWNDLRSTI